MSSLHGISQYLPVGIRSQINPYNAQAAALWGGTGVAGALYLIQPWSWMYNLAFPAPKEESEEGEGEGASGPPPAAQK